MMDSLGIWLDVGYRTTTYLYEGLGDVHLIFTANDLSVHSVRAISAILT